MKEFPDTGGRVSRHSEEAAIFITITPTPRFVDQFVLWAPYTTASSGNLLLKSHYAGETDLVENWLPRPCLVLDKSAPIFPHTHTHPHPVRGGWVTVSSASVTGTFPLLFIRSASYATVVYWLHRGPLHWKPRVKYWKKARLEKSEIMICMKSRVMMITADRKDNEACSEKSMSHWIINSIQPCVEAPEGLMGLYVFLSEARWMEHPCLHAYSICSPYKTRFRLVPPPPQGQSNVLGSNVSSSPDTVPGTLLEFSQ